MSLFDKIFKKPIEKPLSTFQTLTAYRPVFQNTNGCIYENELIRASIDARARHISKLQIEIISGERKTFTYLKNRPNEWQTWGQFLYRLSTILDVQNTAFIVPIENRYGETVGYFPVLPTQCALTEYEGVIYLRYRFQTGKVGAIEYYKCGVMTKYQYKDDFFGEQNNALFSTMNLIGINNQGIIEAVKNSATYRFMARLTNFSKAEDLKNERERFSKENFSGESNGGGLLLFPNTYGDIKQIDTKPFTVDTEQIKLIQTNVYNYFGVNEDVLQNKAFGDKWSAFYEGAIEPFAVQFSDVMTKLLFSNREKNYGDCFMATANRLQYMSNNDKLNVSVQLLDRGILSLNDVRDIWNLPRITEGDAHIIRGEYYPLDAKMNQATSIDAVSNDNTKDNKQNEEEQKDEIEGVSKNE